MALVQAALKSDAPAIREALTTGGVRLALDYLTAAAAHSSNVFVQALLHVYTIMSEAAPAPAPVQPLPPDNGAMHVTCPTCERVTTDLMTPGHCDACGHSLQL